MSMLASGPLTSWPTLEPVLIEMGVFSGPNQQALLNEVNSIATCFALGGGLFAGLC